MPDQGADPCDQCTADVTTRSLWGLRSGPLHGRGAHQGFHEPAGADVGCAALRISVVDGPLTRPPPAEGSYAEPSHGPSVPQIPPAAVLLAGAR